LESNLCVSESRQKLTTAGSGQRRIVHRRAAANICALGDYGGAESHSRGGEEEKRLAEHLCRFDDSKDLGVVVGGGGRS
jgi:hypothetical protein